MPAVLTLRTHESFPSSTFLAIFIFYFLSCAQAGRCEMRLYSLCISSIRALKSPSVFSSFALSFFLFFVHSHGQAVGCEMRLYSNLFTVENPMAPVTPAVTKGGEWRKSEAEPSRDFPNFPKKITTICLLHRSASLR